MGGYLPCSCFELLGRPRMCLQTESQLLVVFLARPMPAPWSGSEPQHLAEADPRQSREFGQEVDFALRRKVLDQSSSPRAQRRRGTGRRTMTLPTTDGNCVKVSVAEPHPSARFRGAALTEAARRRSAGVRPLERGGLMDRCCAAAGRVESVAGEQQRTGPPDYAASLPGSFDPTRKGADGGRGQRVQVRCDLALLRNAKL